MKNIVFLIWLFQFLLSFSCKNGSFIIDNENIGSISIVVPDTANSIVLFAAGELKKHLDLVFDGNIPIIDFTADK